MVAPSTVTREEFAELRADVRSLVEKVDRLSTQLEPLILSRSGELERLRSIDADVQAAHNKIRSNSEAITELREQQAKAKWVMLGAVAALQILWALLLSAPARAIFGHIFGGG